MFNLGSLKQTTLLGIVSKGTSALLASPSDHLQLTALLSHQNGSAYFECWEMSQPFSGYPTVGRSITGLAEVSNVSYVMLPPRSNEGFHNPPHPMLFVLLSGLAHVTIPDGDEEMWIMEGVNGLMIAADMLGQGHVTEYPSDKESVALQIPFKNGVLPDHRVVAAGVCDAQGGLPASYREAGLVMGEL